MPGYLSALFFGVQKFKKSVVYISKIKRKEIAFLSFTGDRKGLSISFQSTDLSWAALLGTPVSIWYLNSSCHHSGHFPYWAVFSKRTEAGGSGQVTLVASPWSRYFSVKTSFSLSLIGGVTLLWIFLMLWEVFLALLYLMTTTTDCKLWKGTFVLFPVHP